MREMHPQQVLLIKAIVYVALHAPLRSAGVPVVDGRLPFPAFGQHVEFVDNFRNLIADRRLTLPGPHSSWSRRPTASTSRPTITTAHESA